MTAKLRVHVDLPVEEKRAFRMLAARYEMPLKHYLERVLRDFLGTKKLPPSDGDHNGSTEKVQDR